MMFKCIVFLLLINLSWVQSGVQTAAGAEVRSLQLLCTSGPFGKDWPWLEQSMPLLSRLTIPNKINVLESRSLLQEQLGSNSAEDVPLLTSFDGHTFQFTGKPGSYYDLISADEHQVTSSHQPHLHSGL